MKNSILLSVGAAFVVILSSCDSPEMVRQRDEQALEITKLRGELAVIEEKLKDLPADKTADLATIEEEAKTQQEEITKLEAEIKDLEENKKSVEKEFEDYKRKYVIR